MSHWRRVFNLVKRYIPSVVMEACSFGAIARRHERPTTKSTLVVALTWPSLHAAVRVSPGAQICWIPLLPHVFRNNNSIIYPGVDHLSVGVFRRWLNFVGKSTDVVATDEFVDKNVLTGLGFRTTKTVESNDYNDASDVLQACVARAFGAHAVESALVRIVVTGMPRRGGKLDRFLRRMQYLPCPVEILHITHHGEGPLTRAFSDRFSFASVIHLSTGGLGRLSYARMIFGELLRSVYWRNPLAKNKKVAKHTGESAEIDEALLAGVDADISDRLTLTRGARSVIDRRVPRVVSRMIPMQTAAMLERMDQFRENTRRIAEFLKADIVHSVDLISAPSGAVLAGMNKARHIVDVNEFPLFEHRVGRDFTSLTRKDFARLYDAVSEPLTSAQARIAYSQGLAKITTMKYRSRTLAIRNFHDLQSLPPNGAMRAEFGISDETFLLVHVCTMSSNYKSHVAIEMMALLPDRYQLVFVGSATNKEYDAELRSLVAKLNLTKRVHFKGEIGNQQEYLSYVSGGDLGLIVISDSIPNVRFGLSNRFADLLASNLPMISTYTVETSPIIRTENIGIVVARLDAAALADAVTAIGDFPERHLQMRKNVDRVRRTFSWEEESERYFSLATGETITRWRHKKSICFVFQRGLVRNRRTLRFAAVMKDRGWRVSFLVGTMPNDAIRGEFPKKSFVVVPANAPLNETSLGRISKQLASAKRKRRGKKNIVVSPPNLPVFEAPLKGSEPFGGEVLRLTFLQQENPS